MANFMSINIKKIDPVVCPVEKPDELDSQFLRGCFNQNNRLTYFLMHKEH